MTQHYSKDAAAIFPLNPTPQDIFQTRVFEEPLVPIGTTPTPAENAALAAAVRGYSKRSGPDDFSSLTSFLKDNPESPWNAALLLNLGLEYYGTGHYSKTMEVWSQAWDLAKMATDPKGKALADRACGELAYMYARLGRMADLEAVLESVDHRVFSGPATEKISGAREGLATMQTRPEIAFRCGPHALHRIKLLLDPENPGTELIRASVSTPTGFSLHQVSELAHQLGVDFQMAFREPGAEFVVPSVLHLKVDHFAAIVRREGDQYLLQDPTFWNDVWVTREALEAEASGYFLVPAGELGSGWRSVEAQEGETIRGKGRTDFNDTGPHGPCDPTTDGGNSCKKKDPACKGLAVPRVHLMLVSLNINDEPVGYSPAVGPAVRFMVRYNQRDAFQPGNFNYSNFGPKWTFDWLSYIKDTPSAPFANVEYYIMGGGTRTFTGFDRNTNTFAFEQYDQTRLTRKSDNSYEMVSPDGTRKLFGQPFSERDGPVGVKRKIFLTSLIDPFGNAVSLTYDENLRVTQITDAVGQVTTISYENPDIFKITRVTDPFGRFATFDYDASGRLVRITDIIGLTSEFTYDDGDFITTLTTPYGITTFTKTDIPINSMHSLETVYPDGNRDRVEFNQDDTSIDQFDAADSVPTGMATFNEFHQYRNTYYWSKIACASAYGDHKKAKIYHWLHVDSDHTAGILEGIKEPLEGRVWYDYAGQAGISGGSLSAGSTNKPAHIGRVLDDGSTQLYTYEYNGFGNVTKTIDPLGRTFSYIYAENGIDLLETRQTRAGQSQLLSKMTYDARHRLLTSTDAAGQTTSYQYNAQGQVLKVANALGDTTSYAYDSKGNLLSIDGPLPGDGDSTTFTYDSVGRVRTKTDESGYTLTFDYDDLDRLTKITFPDSTFDQFTYTLLDPTLIRDRAGRETSFEYNNVRQMTRRTDPLNRVTLFQWCKCGDLKSLTDPMGRTTAWGHDVQGRLKSKEYVDGSKVTYLYEETTSRLRQRIDEQLQVTQYNYNRDDTVSEVSYANAVIATPTVSYKYDQSYSRLTSMKDGIGTTLYSYYPITPTPQLGAGKLAAIDGPLPDDTITYNYDELGRPVVRSINGVPASVVFDAAGRITSETNALGTFNHSYDGSTMRQLSTSYPNGQTTTFGYLDNLSDQRLERITHAHAATPISEFSYGYDVPEDRISTWSQNSGTQTPLVFSLDYDAANQLTAVSEGQSGGQVKTFAYTYDPAGNRLTEQIDGTMNEASYNSLNQITTTTGDLGIVAAYEWDAEHRVTSVNAGNQRTEYSYDGLGRRVRLRLVRNGAEITNRRFVWCDSDICEERTPAGAVSKRFVAQGVKVETGVAAGDYFYTRDHLGSIRELTDTGGSVRARYSYDPFGRRTRVAGDVDADFGFAGMLFSMDTGLGLTRFRVYQPNIGRWSSRDQLKSAEIREEPNLYAYVRNSPINRVDLLGLSCCEFQEGVYLIALAKQLLDCATAVFSSGLAAAKCAAAVATTMAAGASLEACYAKGCSSPPPEPPRPQPPVPPLPAQPLRCIEVAPCHIVCFD